MNSEIDITRTTEPSTTKILTKLKLTDIRTNAGTQTRAALNADIVTQYAEAMLDISESLMPPIVVFEAEGKYVLADGFHRYEAARRNGFVDIRVEVRTGGQDEALRFALRANSQHGLPRSNADKRHAARLALIRWPDLSNVELGRLAAVSDELVRSVRESLQPPKIGGCPAVRTGADGKKRRVPEQRVSKRFALLVSENAPRPTFEVPADPAPAPTSDTDPAVVIATMNPSPPVAEPVVDRIGYAMRIFQEAFGVREHVKLIKQSWAQLDTEGQAEVSQWIAEQP